MLAYHMPQWAHFVVPLMQELRACKHAILHWPMHPMHVGRIHAVLESLLGAHLFRHAQQLVQRVVHDT